MATTESYARLLKLIREQGKLESVMGLLEWDSETLLPPKGLDARGDQRAALAGVVHGLRTSQEIQDLVAHLREQAGDLTDDQRVIIREVGRDVDRMTKVPADLVQAIAKLEPVSASVWSNARANDDFDTFRPYLEKMAGFKIELAEAIGYEEERYDALLDEFEPGMLTSMIAPVLSALKQHVVPLSRKIIASSPKSDTRFHAAFPVDAQENFNRRVINALGFDLEGGRLDTSTHPFCMGLHPTDVRMTTRYNENDFRSSLYGVIHEAGHGMYEQGLDVSWFGTPLGHWSSMGIHESQSRLWENIVGRSRAFWSHFLPLGSDVLPRSIKDLSVEDLFRGANEVSPSFIRVESDEVHYNLHVILRFEIERDLISERIQVKDIPELWREKSSELLNVIPKNDTEGCLQDIHWSMGMYGYFPTYTLGNLYAAMFWEAAQRDLGDLSCAFANGDFSGLLHWLRTNIHQQGRRFPVPELLEQVTGRALTVDSHVDYLKSKYGELYGV